MTSDTRNSTRNTTKKTFASHASVPAIPPTEHRSDQCNHQKCQCPVQHWSLLLFVRKPVVGRLSMANPAFDRRQSSCQTLHADRRVATSRGGTIASALVPRIRQSLVIGAGELPACNRIAHAPATTSGDPRWPRYRSAEELTATVEGASRLPTRESESNQSAWRRDRPA